MLPTSNNTNGLWDNADIDSLLAQSAPLSLESADFFFNKRSDIIEKIAKLVDNYLVNIVSDRTVIDKLALIVQQLGSITTEEHFLDQRKSIISELKHDISPLLPSSDIRMKLNRIIGMLSPNKPVVKEKPTVAVIDLPIDNSTVVREWHFITNKAEAPQKMRELANEALHFWRREGAKVAVCIYQPALKPEYRTWTDYVEDKLVEINHARFRVITARNGIIEKLRGRPEDEWVCLGTDAFIAHHNGSGTSKLYIGDAREQFIMDQPKPAIIDLPTLNVGAIEIPLFDLNEFESSGVAEKKSHIHRFGQALENVGFLAIKAEALTPFIKAAEKEMESYFSQDMQDKKRDCHDNNYQTGYNPPGNEKAAGSKGPDKKETYFIPPNYTKWPVGIPGFKEAMEPYHQELTLVAEKVMGYVADYLGVEKEKIAGGISAANNLLRLAHYLPLGDPAEPWAGAHTDLNLITFLPPAKVPGLQLLTKDGEWKSVEVPEGYLIVNTAEELEFMTAGKIKATKHQVLNPGGEWAQKDRYATIFFASQCNDFVLDPFQNCVDEMTKGMNSEERDAYLMKYPQGVTVLQNLLSRLIEMESFKEPEADLVILLRSKGLLKEPPETIRKLYPEVFDVE